MWYWFETESILFSGELCSSILFLILFLFYIYFIKKCLKKCKQIVKKKFIVINNLQFNVCISFPYCTENETNRDFKTKVRTEPWFLRTVTPLVWTDDDLFTASDLCLSIIIVQIHLIVKK